jgi:murein DD-endopeptidase MepM/ murein hydrolase activator NlpD
MKKHYKKLMILGFFLSAIFAFGQFNTLMPTVPKKAINQTIQEIFKEEKPKKEKKSWKEIFKITTKSDLKNETEGSPKRLKSQIDSLKILMKEYASSNNQKWKVQHSKDSLFLKTQAKAFENKINAFLKYDFVSELDDNFSKIVMPLHNEIQITSGFGIRTHPIFGTQKVHNGIDLKANYENVYAVLDGIVTASGWDPKGGGNYIKVNHFNRFETSYLHLSEIYYRIGEKVKAGFIVGKSGNSGNSTGPHLHFSVKEFGQNINPVHFLNDLIKANNLIATYYAK